MYPATSEPDALPSVAAYRPLPAGAESCFAWLDGRRRAVFVAGLVLQLAVLAAVMALHGLPLLMGETIRLQTVPVDPRDLFRGDYVILSYPFSLRAGELSDLVEGETVYVALQPVALPPEMPAFEIDSAISATHEAGALSRTPPADGPYLRALVSRGQLVAGIETFYVPEGTGHVYEEARNARRLVAEIKLTRWGQARVVRLHLGPDPGSD